MAIGHGGVPQSRPGQRSRQHDGDTESPGRQGPVALVLIVLGLVGRRTLLAHPFDSHSAPASTSSLPAVRSTIRTERRFTVSSRVSDSMS